MASRAEYGANLQAGRNPNADNGWPPADRWPKGVELSQLAVVIWPNSERIVVRGEIAELVDVMGDIAWEGYHRHFLRGWTGGYSNRPIRGSNPPRPSNHSRGLSIDVDASDNPMGAVFRSNLPVGLVRDWQQCGFYWGGFYSSRPDAMHFEFCCRPDEVVGLLLGAKQILARHRSGPSPEGETDSGPNGVGAREWPLAPGHYFGMASGPGESHSGDPVRDNQLVRNYIAKFQKELNDLGYEAGATDGLWSSRTTDATRRWQERNQLPVTGFCTRATWNAIHGSCRAMASNQRAYPGFILKRGSFNPEVEQIQIRLVTLGYLTQELYRTGPGRFGPATHRAVMSFQDDKGLTVDGIVGPSTWAKLFS